MQGIIYEMLDFETSPNILLNDQVIIILNLSINLFSKFSNLIYEVIIIIFNKWSV